MIRWDRCSQSCLRSCRAPPPLDIGADGVAHRRFEAHIVHSIAARAVRRQIIEQPVQDAHEAHDLIDAMALGGGQRAGGHAAGSGPASVGKLLSRAASAIAVGSLPLVTLREFGKGPVEIGERAIGHGLVRAFLHCGGRKSATSRICSRAAGTRWSCGGLEKGFHGMHAGVVVVDWGPQFGGHRASDTY